jgi:hypothetical protein
VKNHGYKQISEIICLGGIKWCALEPIVKSGMVF